MEEQTNKKRISLSQKVCDFIDSLCLSNQEREKKKRTDENGIVPILPFYNTKLFWVMAAIIVVLGFMVGRNAVLRHRFIKHHEKEFASQDSLYASALNNFDVQLQLITHPDDLTSLAPFKEALEELKTIERMEEMVFFEVYKKKPCYQKKLELFKQEVTKEIDVIEGELFAIEQNGDTKSKNYHNYQIKQDMIKEWLSQLEQTGSAMSIE